MALKDLFGFLKKKDIGTNTELVTMFNNAIYGKSEDYSGWVYACVGAIAGQVGMIDLALMREKQNGEKERVFNHDAIKALDVVNPLMSYFDLFERLQSNLELHGAEFWYLAKNKLGQIVEIYPLVSGKVEVLSTESQYVAGYKYTVNGKSRIYTPQDVVMFKNFNPHSDTKGLSTIAAVKKVVETDEDAKTYNQSFFKNNARPDGILKVNSQVSDEQIRLLTRKLNAGFQGSDKAGKNMVIGNNMDYQTVALSHSDMLFIEGRRFSRDEILAIFRVPKIVAGIMEDVNRASADAALYAFMIFTILPKMNRIADSLNKFYLPLFKDSQGLYFEVKNKPPEDEQALMTSIQTGISAGVMSINDGRRKLGLPEIKDGEFVYLPFGAEPFNEPMQGKKNYKKTDKNDENTQVLIKNIIKDVLNDDKVKKKDDLIGGMTLSEFEARGEIAVDKRDKSLKKYEKTLLEETQKFFEDQKKRTINRLIQESKKALDPKSIFPAEYEAQLTLAVYEPILRGIFMEFGESALAEIDASLAFNPAGAEAYVLKNTKKLAGAITKKTSNEIRALIKTGVAQGEGIQQLAKRVSLYSGFGKERSKKIARTESIRSAAQADIAAWEQSGVVDKKVWFTALDERVCEICNSLHGREVGLKSKFISKDEMTDLGISDYNGVLTEPPAHVNCRCAMLPVVSD